MWQCERYGYSVGRIAEVLRKHPAYPDLWANRRTNGPDEIPNLLWNASVYPDDAHSEPWRRYGRSPAHYVNYRILGNQGNRVEPPVISRREGNTN